ncbi:MAG: PilZ domain-containing protein [Spirochaetales bacterium]|nr:PilZ domain-containing protein [Spirochaetales bacterium]
MIGVLLQQDIQFFSSPDTGSTRLTLIILGIVVAVGVLAALMSTRRGGGGKSGGPRGGLNRQAKKLGLSTDQRRVLKHLVVGLNLQNPERILTNSAYMTHALRRRIEQLDSSDDPEHQREQEKSLLFTVKRSLQNATLKLRVMPSSRQIRIGQLVNLQTAEDTRHESMVASNVQNGLGIEVPYTRRAGAMNWKKGTPLQVSFVADQDRMYSFRTRVMGHNKVGGASVMFLEHATNIRQSQKRRSPRREYDRPCYYYPVTVIAVGKGRKAKKQAFVDKNRRIFGRFEDLSSGGCALRTQIPLSAGSILKIDFEAADGSAMSVFGRVRSVDRSRARGRVMHIMFTRVSRKNLNQIQSYVYGLVEAD